MKTVARAAGSRDVSAVDATGPRAAEGPGAADHHNAIRRARPLFLASVRDADEACLAFEHGADVIDAKEPAAGALGAVSPATLVSIRASLPPDAVLSATIGDLPCAVAPIVAAVDAVLANGADYAKVGFFSGDARIVISEIGAARHRRGRMVGLLLADRSPDFDLVAAMADAGFAGVMLDTADKDGRSLTEVIGQDRLRDFLGRAAAAGLFAGLAGALRLSDVPALARLRPDILGFRGALCAGGERNGGLSGSRLAAVRQALRREDAANTVSRTP